MPFDSLTQASDDALLILFANGDGQAARVLTTRLLPRVHAQAQRVLGNGSEAEDIAQEAMIRLWKIAPNWRQGEAKVTTWLYRITANLCIDRLRARRAGVVPLDSVPDPQDTRPGVATQMQDKARQQALREALTELPERQAQAVALRHLEGLSNPEIADILQISTDAVESLTARGKRALAARLAARRSELGYTDDT